MYRSRRYSRKRLATLVQNILLVLQSSDDEGRLIVAGAMPKDPKQSVKRQVLW